MKKNMRRNDENRQIHSFPLILTRRKKAKILVTYSEKKMPQNTLLDPSKPQNFLIHIQQLQPKPILFQTCTSFSSSVEIMIIFYFIVI